MIVGMWTPLRTTGSRLRLTRSVTRGQGRLRFSLSTRLPTRRLTQGLEKRKKSLNMRGDDWQICHLFARGMVMTRRCLSTMTLRILFGENMGSGAERLCAEDFIRSTV